MKKATDLQVLMLAAVRADEKVGRGSDSIIDSYDDDKLLRLLTKREATSPAHAAKIARLEQQRYVCSEQHWEMT